MDGSTDATGALEGYNLIKCVNSTGRSSASSFQTIRMEASNSPHPISVTSKGGWVNSRVGWGKLGWSWKMTLDMDWARL